MSAPRFSIITCTRNSAATLRETISSVNGQRFKSFEHIFVDGNSSDETLSIIREMSPGSLILEGVVGGISRAMNEGAKHATGEIIVHLHSDDLFANFDVLEVVDDFFSSPNVFWAIGRYEYLFEKERKPGALVAPLSLNRLGLGNYIPHNSTFIRRDFFIESGGFSEFLRYCMDYDLWFRLFKRSEPEFIPKVLAVFRVHDGSVSTANRRSTLWEEFKVRMKYFNVSPQTIPRYIFRFMKRWRVNGYVLPKDS